MRRLLILLTFLALPAFGAELGDDGLHKADWIRDTFKDLTEDLAEANAEGKRLVLMVEQRGCIYCAKMHEQVFSRPDIADYIREHFFVVQINLHGSTGITDFDGEELTEREAARKWGLLFTPSILFMPKEVGENQSAHTVAVALMPGAFGPGTTLDMFTWVKEERYALDGDEDFQRYHARRISERAAGKSD